MKKNPYISFVIVARNDDYGGNFLHRMNNFAEVLLGLLEKYSLDSELVIIDWNPPKDKEKIADAIIWPTNLKYAKVRFIEVPPELHNQLPRSEKMPMFEFLAKNVGARRANGEYVLVTNPDIIFNEELIKFLAKKNLSGNYFYRIDRYDIPDSVPFGDNIAEILDFSEKNWTKKHTLEGSLNREFPYIDAGYLRSVLGTLKNRITGSFDTKIHTNASGDFFLMSKDQWEKLKGYPELPLPCFVDSYLCFIAASSGLFQKILNKGKRIYHQSHGSYVNRAKYYNEYQDYKNCVRKMMKARKPLIINDEKWGLGKEKLTENPLK